MIQNYALEIVDSFSKSEKRQFRLELNIYSKKNGNHIEKLFDIYCKNKNIQVIKEIAQVEITSTRVNKLHSELYNKLKEFIGNLERKKDRKYKLYNNIFISKGFLKRKLYHQAYIIIEKTIKEAKEYEIYPVLVEAYSVMQFLQKYIGSIEKIKPFDDTILDDYLAAIEENYDFYRIFNLYSKLQIEYSKNGPLRDKSDFLDYEKQAEGLEINISNSFNINKVTLLSLSMLGLLKQDSEMVIKTKEKLYYNYLNHPKFIRNNPSDFFLTCYNYAGNLIDQNQLEKVKKVLERLNSQVNEENVLKNKKAYVNGLYLNYHLKSRKIKQALQYADDFKNFLAISEDLIYINYIAVNIVLTYLINNKLNEAIDTINTVLNRSIKNLRKDCYSLLLTYEILIYIKLEWIDLVPSKINSLNRYLKLYYNKTAFEKWILTFLNRTQRVDFKQACQEAYDSVKKLETDELSKDILELSDFKMWFEHELGIN